MRFRSTRGNAKELGFSGALLAGLASDGGLYVPERFPKPKLPARTPGLVELGVTVLAEFAEGDTLRKDLKSICSAAWDFPVPLRLKSSGPRGLLELFHGPTAAFKDFAARFLAECALRLPARKPRLVLVATSGDTGGAVASAFHGKAGFEVAVLFPKGRISERQEKQLTAWGGNVRAFAVNGTFDDCQALAKEAFLDPELQGAFELMSANSINIGRILPQSVYYAWASLEYREKTGSPAGFIVPTGNLGNALACVWAREMGFPIREVALALNANRPIEDFLNTGDWKPQPARATLANAMDVGNPSNLERLRNLFPAMGSLRGAVRARSFDDEGIREAIRAAKRDWGETICPHTATAYALSRELAGRDWVVVATAHPAKFETIVEPLVGEKIPVPSGLAALLGKPSKVEALEPRLADLREALL